MAHSLLETLWQGRAAQYEFRAYGSQPAADWGVDFRETWNSVQHLHKMIGTKFLFMELGVYEARSGCFMLDFVLTHPESRYVGVDKWDGEHGEEQYAVATRNLGKHAKERWKLVKGMSPRVFFNSKLFQPFTYDVIYVDGGHVAAQALRDVVFVWEMLKKHGVLIVDDYENRDNWVCSQPVTQGVNNWLRVQPDWMYTVLKKKKQLVVVKNGEF